MMLPRLCVRNAKLSVRLLPLLNITSARLPPLHRCTFATSRKLYNSDNSGSNNARDGTNVASLKLDKPLLMIAFTCKKCNTRSSHTMSKQAYKSGTVLITCPSCHNKHLIADHLKIFRDENITIEDILKAKGESVSTNTGDLVFEDIPKSLRSVIGHHATDAPQHLKKDLDNENLVHPLPHPDTNSTDEKK